jgi:hypothetical protein
MLDVFRGTAARMSSFIEIPHYVEIVVIIVVSFRGKYYDNSKQANKLVYGTSTMDVSMV